MATVDSPLATLGRIPGATGVGATLGTVPWLPPQLAPQPPGVLGWGRMSLLSDPNLLAQNGPGIPAQANAPKPLTEPGMGGQSKLPSGLLSQIQRLARTPTALDLFDTASKLPDPNDVQQGFIGDCPVAAVLLAMAITPKGKQKIVSMIQDLTVSALDSVESNGTRHTTTRKLHVTFTAGNTDITDYVWMNGFSATGTTPPANLEMLFLHSGGNPTSGVMWPSFIEKAYVVLKGSSYDVLDGRNTQEVMNDFWGDHTIALFDTAKAEISTGVQAGTCNSAGCTFTTSTPFDLTKPAERAKFITQLTDLLKNVTSKPTFAGTVAAPTNGNLDKEHGYAIEGFASNQIKLVNPRDPTAPSAKPRKVQLKMDEFLVNFNQLLQGN
jgi:hypothetical protein